MFYVDGLARGVVRIGPFWKAWGCDRGHFQAQTQLYCAKSRPVRYTHIISTCGRAGVLRTEGPGASQRCHLLGGPTQTSPKPPWKAPATSYNFCDIDEVTQLERDGAGAGEGGDGKTQGARLIACTFFS